MNRYATGILAAIAAVLLTVPAEAQKKTGADAMFEAARQKETLEGDLSGAIKQYNVIVAKYKSDRAVTAMAMVRMAECYHKMGNAESTKLFERVIREYGDQKDAVAVAHARLTSRTSAQSGRRIHQIVTDRPLDQSSAPSPDGRYLAFTDWETGDLALMDLATSAHRRLTSQPSRYKEGYASTPRFSSAAQSVVFTWLKTIGAELRLMEIAGSKPRILYSNPEFEYVEAVGFTPDGKFVVAILNATNDSSKLALISTTGQGRPQFLKSLPWGSLGRASVSPDGRLIAYDVRTDENKPGRRVTLLALDGSREVAVTAGDTRDEVFGWVQGKSTLLFASDRGGKRDLWSIAVVDGIGHGQPERVRSDIGNAQPLGLTMNGSLFYYESNPTTDIFVAPWDWRTGKLAGEPQLQGRLKSTNRNPAWSPDGKQIAYLTGGGSSGTRISISSVESGDERALETNLPRINEGPLWSPDGKFLLVMGVDGRKRQGAFTVDVQTGNPTAVALDQVGTVFTPQWLPDGKSIVYYRRDRTSPPSRLIVRDIQTGAERELESGAESASYIATALSPDGRLLAYSADRVLRVVPVAGGLPRELHRIEDIHGRLTPLGWSPDSAQVIFETSRHMGIKVVDQQRWRALAQGGAPIALAVDEIGRSRLQFHPDGKRITFYVARSNAGVWVMDNFLPPASPKQ